MPGLTPNRLRSFFAQLKRRKVYNVAVAYVMVGWIVIDAASTILPQLKLPGWSVTLIATLVIFGFPIAVLLAWAYELTPGGIRRDLDNESTLELPAGTEHVPTESGSAPLRSAVLLLALVTLLAGGWLAVKLVLTRGSLTPTQGPAARSAEAGQPAHTARPLDRQVVAVLPLENISSAASEDQYLADGMTEALISTLMQVRDLRIIASTSVMQYRDTTDKTVREIARELNAGTIIEGGIRKAGQVMRISLRVTDASSRHTHSLLNAERSLQPDRLLSLQDEVARTAARELGDRLGIATRLRGNEGPTPGIEAHKTYLQARRYWRRRTVADVRRSVELFRQAIEEDPEYAKAYAGLADALIILGYLGGRPPAEAYPEARRHAERAIALDGSLAEAHNALAYVHYAHGWEWEKAEKQFRRAIELNNSHATTRHWYGWFLEAMGRHEEALRQLHAAERYDPRSLMIPVSRAWCHYYHGEHDTAAQIYRGILNEDPHFLMALRGLGFALVQRGKPAKALQPLRRAIEIDGEDPASVAALGYAEAKSGDTGKAQNRLKGLQNLTEDRYVPAISLARLHVGLGQHEKAIAQFRRAAKRRSESVLTLRLDPLFKPLRSQPAYEELLDRISLPPLTASLPPASRRDDLSLSNQSRPRSDR